MARAPGVAGTGSLANRGLQLKECLRGMAAQVAGGPHSEGTGSPTQPVVAAQGAPAGDGSA